MTIACNVLGTIEPHWSTIQKEVNHCSILHVLAKWDVVPIHTLSPFKLPFYMYIVQ